MHDQADASVRCEWGPVGATAVARSCDVAVVVDVLSFTTTVSVALDRGIEVIPCATHDDAVALAREHDARRAVPRSEAQPGDLTLSPLRISTIEGPGRVVLPSPNGATISARLAQTGVEVLAASLRNRVATGRWLLARRAAEPDLAVAVVAAGERWPDGSLRPATEDLWGAGALVATLQDGGWTTGLSPEAVTAAAAFAAVRDDLAAHLRSCASGRELIELGHPGDVDAAAELDAGDTVALLDGPAFRAQR